MSYTVRQQRMAALIMQPKKYWYREALVCGFQKNESATKFAAHQYNGGNLQTIKQNQSGIRNTPGTALKSAITGEIIYTPVAVKMFCRKSFYIRTIYQ